MNKYLPLLVLGIVFVSGCVGGTDIFKGIFGTQTPAEEKTPDIVIMQNFDVLPSPPITAESDFTVVFDIKNQDLSQSVDNVNLRLFDWGACTPKPAEFLPDSTEWVASPAGTTPDYTNLYSRTFDELVPQQEERIELGFSAPTNEKIGFIATDCPIKWDLAYTFNSRSADDYTVISQQKLRELQTSGAEVTVTDQAQQIGIGPVSIYFDFKTDNPAKSLGTIQFSIQVKDRGTGIFSEVPANTLYLKVPSDWTEIETACGDKFTKLGDESGYMIYQNSKPIQLIKRTSSEIICRFKASDLDSLNIPEKSYLVSANITQYTYKLQGEETVRIEPSV